MSKNVLTETLLAPLNGAETARIDIDVGNGNLAIQPLASGEGLLASGRLQYLVNKGLPIKSQESSNGQAALSLKAGGAGRPRFRFPWSACGEATEWDIQLNPTVSSDIKAHSDGGNLILNLSGMSVTHLSAVTGGGNIDVDLPDKAANMIVTARSGAGNVVVRIPIRIAALIHATTGLGKAIMSPRFDRIDRDTYQSPGFDGAANKVEITVHSGAGNVSVIDQ